LLVETNQSEVKGQSAAYFRQMMIQIS